ncbi:MAG: HEPN domain-containing protein [Bacillota bacterium]
MSELEAEQRQEAVRWLRYAQEDLLTAQAVEQNPSLARREVCWLAQQAVEKALKAALVFCGVDFPRTHDLDILCRLLPDGWATRERFPDLTELTAWAIAARYPGEWSEPTVVQAARALELATKVFHSIRADLAVHGFPAARDPADDHDQPAHEARPRA